MIIFWIRFKGCTNKIGLLIGRGMSGVKSYSRIFDLSGWKDRVAVRWESLGRAGLKEMISSLVLDMLSL